VRPLYLARRVLEQERRQRGRKVYSLHAPEVECIGKGKAHQPYEFGVKVSVATPVKHSAGSRRRARRSPRIERSRRPRRGGLHRHFADSDFWWSTHSRRIHPTTLSAKPLSDL